MIISTPAIKYQEGLLSILDQQLLPQQEVWVQSHSIDEMCTLIKALKIRGAPLIGLAALLALVQLVEQGGSYEAVIVACNDLCATRPTAVNLKNYLDELQRVITDSNYQTMVPTLAERIFKEDEAMCLKMAENGLWVLKEHEQVLTICNTGCLATGGIGTALGVIQQGLQAGRIEHVYACETRPLLQGGRLTAWELEKMQAPYSLICDNMAATLMQKARVTAVFAGADRIARNGDVANKIGTYMLAVLAKYHNIPFYIVAPETTIDVDCASGQDIVIEERDANEVRGVRDYMWAPQTAPVYNPAFDVTPHELITAIILDTGVVKDMGSYLESKEYDLNAV